MKQHFLPIIAGIVASYSCYFILNNIQEDSPLQEAYWGYPTFEQTIFNGLLKLTIFFVLANLTQLVIRRTDKFKKSLRIIILIAIWLGYSFFFYYLLTPIEVYPLYFLNWLAYFGVYLIVSELVMKKVNKTMFSKNLRKHGTKRTESSY